MKITKGANAPLPTGVVKAMLGFALCKPGYDVDVSLYLLTESGKVRGDADMVFYNQLEHVSGAVKLTIGAVNNHITFDPSKVPTDITRIAICLVVDGVPVSKLGEISLSVAEGPEYSHFADGQEQAVIVGEFYLKNGVWKLRAVGQGFNGGLAPLARSFGMDVEEPTPATTPAPSTPPTPPVNLSKVELRKHKVGVSLAKHGIPHQKAEVLFVIDASGSMARLYQNGTVQETVERIVPVALRLDDDGKLDTYFYATECARVEALTEASMIDFVKNTLPYPGQEVVVKKGGLFSKDSRRSIGFGNNEPVVMNKILSNEPFSRKVPLFIIFLTDGGIDYHTSDVIKDILRKCSSRPIFWQYVGVGNADYGVLRDLDTIAGRKVDNAGFFAIDDLSRISDDDLYDRLLSEFPLWLKAAKAQGILK